MLPIYKFMFLIKFINLHIQKNVVIRGSRYIFSSLVGISSTVCIIFHFRVPQIVEFSQKISLLCFSLMCDENFMFLLELRLLIEVCLESNFQ